MSEFKIEGGIHKKGDLVIGKQTNRVVSANGEIQTDLTKVERPDGTTEYMDRLKGGGVTFNAKGEFLGYDIEPQSFANQSVENLIETVRPFFQQEEAKHKK